MKKLGSLSKWETQFSGSKRLFLRRLTYDGDLAIELVDVSSKLDVNFLCKFHATESFRVVNESYYNNVWPEGFDSRRWGRSFTVEKSPWIGELREDPVFQIDEESCDRTLIHYLIISLDEIVEVLAEGCNISRGE